MRHGRRGRRYLPLKILVGTLLAVVVLVLCGLVVMSLWNWLVPDLFGGKSLGFAQAVGLLVLARILFGGIRGFGGGRHHHWRRRLSERWEEMTPEERERFRSGMRGRCGHIDPPPPAQPSPSA
jgi:hypothetical protein